MWKWIFNSLWRWVAFCVLFLVLGVGIPIYFTARADSVDDFGNRCPNGRVWVEPDGGACYRECVLAATKSNYPEWGTQYCVREACRGYVRVCRE